MIPSAQNKEYNTNKRITAHPVPLELARLSHCPLTVSPEGVPRAVQKRFDYTHAYNALNIIKTCILLLFIGTTRVMS